MAVSSIVVARIAAAQAFFGSHDASAGPPSCMTKIDVDLAERVRAAAAGDRTAAREVLEAVQHDVYGLSLRMLGHPADAEDAAQEILVIVLTHLGSFRGESSLRTWVWRIAANHLKR